MISALKALLNGHKIKTLLDSAGLYVSMMYGACFQERPVTYGRRVHRVSILIGATASNCVPERGKNQSPRSDAGCREMSRFVAVLLISQNEPKGTFRHIAGLALCQQAPLDFPRRTWIVEESLLVPGIKPAGRVGDLPKNFHFFPK